MPIINDYVEYYPARILLEVDTQESRGHGIKHLLQCFKWIEWIPLTETWLVICHNLDSRN